MALRTPDELEGWDEGWAEGWDGGWTEWWCLEQALRVGEGSQGS